MVNIQIRGNLIDIEMTSISKYNFDNLFTGKFSGDHIKDFLSTSSDCKTIYKNTLPIIEPNSEFQVTSFENDNYYDDGYGAAFETELMDLDYRNFEDNEIQISTTRLFGGTNRVITSMKLNHLPLEDLKRSKYDIVSKQILFFEKSYESYEINLSKNLEDQGKITHLSDDNSDSNEK